MCACLYSRVETEDHLGGSDLASQDWMVWAIDGHRRNVTVSPIHDGD